MASKNKPKRQLRDSDRRSSKSLAKVYQAFPLGTEVDSVIVSSVDEKPKNELISYLEDARVQINYLREMHSAAESFLELYQDSLQEMDKVVAFKNTAVLHYERLNGELIELKSDVSSAEKQVKGSKKVVADTASRCKNAKKVLDSYLVRVSEHKNKHGKRVAKAVRENTGDDVMSSLNKI